MKTVSLGNSDITMAPLAFGGNIFGWTTDRDKSFELLDACINKGITMIDTADVYSAWAPGNSGGESERMIGKWLAETGKRDKIILASKVGMALPSGQKGLSKKHILEGIDGSLERLQTDYVDVFYAHKDDPETPFGETLEAFQEVLESGKAKYIASSNYSPERLAAILQYARDKGLPEFIAHQPRYNLYDRSEFENGLRDVCQEFGLGVVTYFSLASGFLTGKYRSEEDIEKSGRKDFLRDYMSPRGKKIVAALNNVSERHNVSAATIAIAWIIQRPLITAPIASATSTAQLEQLVAAIQLPLSPEDIRELDNASDE